MINIFFYIITYNNYFQEYEVHNIDSKTYILADSHGTPLPKEIKKIELYNFSSASDSYLDMLRKVKYLINNTDVERIILTVDNYSLSKYREFYNNLDKSIYYTNLFDSENKLEYLKTYINKFIPIVNSKSRDIVKRFLSAKLFSSKKSLIEYNSWADIPSEIRLEKCKKKVKIQYFGETISSPLLFSLKKIIKICKQNNIELIGLKFPLTHEYLNIIGDRNYGADSIFSQNNLLVYDFSHLYTNKDEYFSNQDHLNKVGGEYFLQVIFKAILNESNGNQNQ